METGDYYAGEVNPMSGDSRNGYGVWISQMGLYAFEGTFFDGQREGYGRVILLNGNFYEG